MSFSRRYRIAKCVLLAMVVALLTAFTPGLSAQTRTLTVDDLRLEIGLSSPVIWPDGQADSEEGESGPQLFVLSRAGGEATQLTDGFDFDRDGDLDLCVANMDGDANGLFRNDGIRFVDVAIESGLDAGGRALGVRSNGTVRPTLVDFDNDGALDVFMANYGPNGLFRNTGDGRFENVAPRLGLAIDGYYDTGTWGDYNNDGRLDLYVNGTVTGGQNHRDYLLHNDGDRFTDVTPRVLGDLAADHGAHWADFDNDGALDLALTGATADGMHYVAFNGASEQQARRSLQVLVLDDRGHYTRAGSEIRVFAGGTGRLLGMGIVDTGSGYNSQNAMPVHFGLAEEGLVDVEVTTMTTQGRKTARVSEVDPMAYAGRWLVVKVDADGQVQEIPGGSQ